AVQFDYKVDDKGIIIQTQIDDNERRPELVVEDFGWAKNMYQDMFG
ncbi:MAG: NAD(P)/FAD-dependent oxidoreductase, partial [Rhodocyclaceae bacterium]|nr:NAD(P)/FAD-dependent oxidoreductase [Rhodocyclaceae bacterium]